MTGRSPTGPRRARARHTSMPRSPSRRVRSGSFARQPSSSPTGSSCGSLLSRSRWRWQAWVSPRVGGGGAWGAAAWHQRGSGRPAALAMQAPTHCAPAGTRTRWACRIHAASIPRPCVCWHDLCYAASCSPWQRRVADQPALLWRRAVPTVQHSSIVGAERGQLGVSFPAPATLPYHVPTRTACCTSHVGGMWLYGRLCRLCVDGHCICPLSRVASVGTKGSSCAHLFDTL